MGRWLRLAIGMGLFLARLMALQTRPAAKGELQNSGVEHSKSLVKFGSSCRENFPFGQTITT
jgi:hypothetical protein